MGKCWIHYCWHNTGAQNELNIKHINIWRKKRNYFEQDILYWMFQILWIPYLLRLLHSAIQAVSFSLHFSTKWKRDDMCYSRLFANINSSFNIHRALWLNDLVLFVCLFVLFYFIFYNHFPSLQHIPTNKVQ